MIIYLLYCLVSRKGYVGQTTRSLQDRWSQHCAYARGGSEFSIHAAIREHGAEAFDVSILETTDNLEDLNALETEQIKKQNTLSPNGYNRTSGGQRAHHFSAETKAKMSAIAKGKQFSEKTRAKISAANLARGARPPTPIIGYRHSEETKVKMSAAKLGKKLNYRQTSEHKANAVATRKRNRELREMAKAS